MNLLQLAAEAADPHEWAAAKLAAEVLESTDLVPAREQWIKLRPAIAVLLRNLATQLRADARGPITEPEVLLAFASDVDGAAREIDRADERRRWRAWRELRRGPMGATLRRSVLEGMRDTWRAFARAGT